MSLTPFQKEKLEYYFNFFGLLMKYSILCDILIAMATKQKILPTARTRGQMFRMMHGIEVRYRDFPDSNSNGHLELSDLKGFMEKVLDFTGWSKDSTEARECEEVHECFFSTLLEKADKPGTEQISLSKWLRMWEKLVPGCTAMINFPIWLRLLPKSLFRIIDKNHDGKIDVKELSDFYVQFVGIPKENVGSLASYAMEQMTDHGKYPLTLDSYNQIFANFLIGKTPYGPGRFIFGCFEHMVQRTEYQLIQGPGEDVVDPALELKRLQIAQNSPSTPNSIVKVKFFRAA